ncbi:unnamed protein product [Amoebophrya sp. A25]|nr:unnamed protein product [Amoebophrya sp. A25]|eukprot:GSA25T00011579001.1
MDLRSDFMEIEIVLDAKRPTKLPHLLLYAPSGAGMKMVRV